MNKKMLIWLLIIFAALVLIFLNLFTNTGYAVKDSFNSQNLENDDICTAPEGTSQEDWNVHMSHHPNIYKNCFD